MRSVCVAAITVVSLAVPAAASAAPFLTEADKDGYGTSTTTSSKVLHTLDDGRLTEVFYPDLNTPSVRTLDFIVSDGRTFAERDSEAAHRVTRSWLIWKGLGRPSTPMRSVATNPGRMEVNRTPLGAGATRAVSPALRSAEATPETRFAPERLCATRTRPRRISAIIALVVVLP